MSDPRGLRRQRFVVDRVDWTAKSVRTGGISGPLHEEWSLTLGFVSDEPMRGVAYLDVGAELLHARDWARRAERSASLTVSFRPVSWIGSDSVSVSVAGPGISHTVDSTSLKVDPRAACSVTVEQHSAGATGTPLTILSSPEDGFSIGVLLLAAPDTKSDRTRWRVRDQHVESLGDFTFLATGERSGRVLKRS